MAEWQNPETFAIWLGLIILISMILISAILILSNRYFRRILKEQNKLAETKINYQKQLLKDSIEIQESERSRIAADLHDDLIGKLNSINLILHTILKKGEDRNSLQMLEDSIHLTREISHNLMPPLIEQSNLDELICNILYPYEKEYLIKYHKLETSAKTVEPGIKLQILRILQEVLTNIRKHADADCIWLDYFKNSQFLFLKIADNGKGLLPNRENKGLGLKNIELRSKSLNAQYKIKRNTIQHTIFLFYIPIS